MRAALALCCLLALTGCGSSRRPISLWQHFDALRPPLERVTHDSQKIAVQMRSVRGRVARGDVRATRAAAAGLKRLALRFSLEAGDVGNTIRVLRHSSPSGYGREYLAAVLESLQASWWEGHHVARLMDVIWSDPLMMSPADLVRMNRLQAQAVASARAAARAARSADGIRRTHRRAFRYAPVRPARAE